MCPKTWQVIMSCDIVPQMGKFGRMYKHPGHRVILDKKGSILVRPTPLELHLRPGVPPAEGLRLAFNVINGSAPLQAAALIWWHSRMAISAGTEALPHVAFALDSL